MPRESRSVLRTSAARVHARRLRPAAIEIPPLRAPAPPASRPARGRQTAAAARRTGGLPRNSPGPRIIRSRRATSKPSLRLVDDLQPLARACPTTAPRRAGCSSSASEPRPMRPRSWCNCARPKRSACSITISVALRTSTPTSITVVATSTSISSGGEPPHHVGLLGCRQLAVEQTDAQVGQQPDDACMRLGRRGGLHDLAGLDQWADPVSLAARRDIGADARDDLVAPPRRRPAW